MCDMGERGSQRSVTSHHVCVIKFNNLQHFKFKITALILSIKIFIIFFIILMYTGTIINNLLIISIFVTIRFLNTYYNDNKWDLKHVLLSSGNLVLRRSEERRV